MAKSNHIHSNLLEFPADERLDLGNSEDFDRVFIRFYAPLCQFAVRYVEEPADAEDAVESLFLRLWNKGGSFENMEHARAFLYKSTYHSCLNQKRGRIRALSRDEDYAQDFDWVDEGHLSNLLRSELVAMIYREIDRLPKQYADVLKLSFQEELTNEAIADRLNLRIQTVKNYKSKGLAMLKNRIPPEAFLALIGFCVEF